MLSALSAVANSLHTPPLAALILEIEGTSQ